PPSPQDKWGAAAQAAGGAVELEVLEQLSLLTLDTLQRCIFSHHSHCQREPSEYIKAILELSTLVVRRQQRPLHHPTWLYRLTADGGRFAHACATVHGFTATVVRRRRRAIERLGHQEWLESHQGRRMDFIDLLLLAKDEDGNALSDEDISAEANTFMFEVPRRCTEDIAMRDGRVVPKGVICLMSIYGTHHNPDLWPDPQVYNPLRFSPENSDGRAPLAFIPFSAGP
ncbi:PREDICTED: cytochrome P450 4F22-like, partial [Mesitornis unicolor]|uniref:cytochrome P450 4F22-like n=1 Tax=Mesitornis unicolor TaxID=54374 RepID=UPI00052914F5